MYEVCFTRYNNNNNKMLIRRPQYFVKFVYYICIHFSLGKRLLNNISFIYKSLTIRRINVWLEHWTH